MTIFEWLVVGGLLLIAVMEVLILDCISSWGKAIISEMEKKP